MARRTLVIGGTGPTGRWVVEGLLDSGDAVTILHGGQHEVDFSRPVEHLHADVHFVETLTAALAGRDFDVVVAMYGRTRLLAEVLAGRTARLVAIGGSAYSRDETRHGPLGAPAVLDEHAPMVDDPNGPRLQHKVWLTEQALLGAHAAGAFAVTVLRYPPVVYGPGALAPRDWSVVRRILDGRARILVAHGGTTVRSRVYAANAARAVLLAVAEPSAAGQIYNVADDEQHSEGQLIQYVAGLLGRQVELVGVPGEIATKVYRHVDSSHQTRLLDTGKIRRELGYSDAVAVPAALAATVEWLQRNPLPPGGEAEQQLGDPFDYALEDRIAQEYGEVLARTSTLESVPGVAGHMYRHPTRPGEGWRSPS
ncbi:MAG: NAD-dependent epimerase/dehydratase family protein [Actinomycetota bacterium]|nr:MAG: NAD-dependent epimerase/dehydratase family protein [Actinomycetota bacterium]